jgi:outer membrane protein assembly factor BamB
VVWGDRIFLTAFEPEAGLLRTIAGYPGRLWVLCFRRTDGRELWRREVKADAFFGSFGLVTCSMDGAPVWDLKIGPYANHMGSGSSPVFAGGHLILNAESDGPSFLYSMTAAPAK